MRTFILLGLIIASNACRVTDDEPAAKLAVERARAAREPAEPQIGYPEGPWWSEDTGRLLLAGSHILVSHRETKPTQRLIWANPVDRSRLEAKQRAWKLYLELRSNAERFAEVAARESDEPITRSFGGALGTFYVDSVPHVFLDAFGHVREGEVTRPVETEQGFHVLRRQKPTAPIRLNLAHLVIKYEGVSGWLRNDRVAVNRSREAAQALAERVAREAQQAPDRFADLVREYSDAEDALRDGDMGALSSHDVTDPADAPLIAVAERLPEGASRR